jgi:hypothetical protein
MTEAHPNRDNHDADQRPPPRGAQKPRPSRYRSSDKRHLERLAGHDATVRIVAIDPASSAGVVSVA